MLPPKRKPRIRKIFVITTIATLIGITGIFCFQRRVLPAIIAKSLNSQTEDIYLIPEKYKPALHKARVIIRKQVDEMPGLMDSLHLNFDDLVKIIESIDGEEVIRAIDELNLAELSDSDQAFDILKKNIRIKGYDLEMFRGIFRKKITLSKINRALRKISENQMTTTVSIPVARETVKQILFDNREKIEKNMESIHQSTAN